MYIIKECGIIDCDDDVIDFDSGFIINEETDFLITMDGFRLLYKKPVN